MMTGKERANKFWEIRRRNDRRDLKREKIRKIKENMYVILIAIVLIIAIGVNKKIEASTKEASIGVENNSLLTDFSQQTIYSNTNTIKVDIEEVEETKVDLSSKVQYQNITFTNVNVRKNPDINSEILGEIPQNTLVDVLEDMGVWIKIIYNNDIGYIKSEYVGTMFQYKKYNSTKEKVFTGVNIRTSPSEDSESIATLDAGSDIDVIKEEENGWTQILYNDNIYYIKSDYVGNDEEYKEYQDNLDKTPYSDYLVEKYGFSKDLQKYTYNLCEEFYPADPEHYYAFLLAVMQQESDFGRDRSHYNSNGTTDLGIMQVNSCNWKELKKKGLISSYDMSTLTCDELQYDDYINIRAALDEINICVNNHGVSENAYYSYNTGRHKKKGTNKNSHKVWKYYGEWCSRLYQE